MSLVHAAHKVTAYVPRHDRSTQLHHTQRILLIQLDATFASVPPICM